MLIFKALHILSMVAMVTVFSGAEFFYTFAVWRRDVRALAWLHGLVRQTGLPFFGLGFLLSGILFGLLTALTGGLDFFEGWLIVAYVLVALFFVNSFVIGGPMIRLGDKAEEAEAGQRPVEEVVREMAASRAVFFFFSINVAIFAALILDMVLKPF
jgi:uncharacterized membrane protein